MRPPTRASSWARGSARTRRCSTWAIAYLVATADPITFATDEAGWYALHVNANDIAVRGARPTWFLATVLLPEGGATEATRRAPLCRSG